MSNNNNSNVLSFGSFLQQLKPRLTTPQFFWFLGHLATITSTLSTVLFSIFSQRSYKRYYNVALLSIILTYSIVIFQVFKSSKSKMSLFNLKTNDNLQYLSLAIVWYFVSNVKIISGGLYPFLIFSFFHAINYFKNFILPIAPSLTSQKKNDLAKVISSLISKYNEQSLIAASNLEIFILVQLLLGSPFILFYLIKNFTLALVNIIVLLQYVAFIKLRYRQSKHTKLLFDAGIYKIEAYLNSGPIPPVVTNYYYQLKAQATHLVQLIPV